MNHITAPQPAVIDLEKVHRHAFITYAPPGTADHFGISGAKLLCEYRRGGGLFQALGISSEQPKPGVKLVTSLNTTVMRNLRVSNTTPWEPPVARTR